MWWEGPDPPLPFSVRSGPCSGATLAARTASIAPLPALSDKCSANLKCVPNKYCKKLKRLKQTKKHVEKREGKQEKWEKKCSPSEVLPPTDL